MTSLGELREALDKIDNEIAELYEKRMEVCRKVGEYKVKSGKKVFDRQREKEKLADVMSKVEGDFNKKGIQELYQQLMSMSRKLQYSQLVEAGALGRLPFIRIENLDRENARVVFQGTEVKGIKLLAAQIEGVDMNGLRELGDQLKEKLGDGVVVLASGSDGKVSLMATATDGAMKKGAHAGNLVKAIAGCVGGGGGGRPNMAQAGGKNPSGIQDALKKAEEVLAEQIKE